jgi:hypothetical protein
LFIYSVRVCTGLNLEDTTACLREKSNIMKLAIPTVISAIWYIRILSHVLYDKFCFSQVIGAVSMIVNLVIYRLTCTEMSSTDHSQANFIIWSGVAILFFILYMFVLFHRLLKQVDFFITKKELKSSPRAPMISQPGTRTKKSNITLRSFCLVIYDSKIRVVWYITIFLLIGYWIRFKVLTSADDMN